MSHAEEEAIRERMQAMDAEQMTVAVKEVPDGILLRELISRYSYMIDLKDAYSNVELTVNRAHERGVWE